MTVVICVRDPDASNDYRVFGEDVTIIDVDLGYSDLSHPEEFADWKESHISDAADLERDGEQEAADYLRGLVAEIESNFGHNEEADDE